MERQVSVNSDCVSGLERMERAVQHPLVVMACEVLGGVIVKLGLWVLLCTSAWCGEAPGFLVRVSNATQDGFQSASGCIVKVSSRTPPGEEYAGWKLAHIVTALHSFSPIAGRITVTYRTGQMASAVMLASGEEPYSDIAILQAWCPPESQAIEVGQPPRAKEHVLIFGLGGVSAFWPKQGEAREVPAVVMEHRHYLMLNAIVISGDSGGPIVCEKGRLLGVVRGMSSTIDPELGEMWRAVSIRTDRLREFIQQAIRE